MQKSNIKQIKEAKNPQFQYLGRWVDKATFRAFVYDKDGNETLADTYEEFESLTASGLWFASKPVYKERKHKDAICSNS